MSLSKVAGLRGGRARIRAIRARLKKKAKKAASARVRDQGLKGKKKKDWAKFKIEWGMVQRWINVRFKHPAT